MPWSDLAVLLAIVTATPWCVARLRRRDVHGARLVRAGGIAFLGVVLVVTMTAHCFDVVSRLVIGTSHEGAPFRYDFRAYSLLLLGGVLVAAGLQLLRLSPELGAGTAGGRARAVRSLVAVLGLVAPLIPVHGFFAIPLTVLGSAALLLALWRPGARDARPASAGDGLLVG